MWNSANYNSSSNFDEAVILPFSEQCDINQAFLLEQLRNLKTYDALQFLHTAIDALRDQLEDPESPLRTPGSSVHTLTVSLDYLVEELEQIAAAHTLQRAHYYINRLIRGLTEERTNCINDINLNRWKEYTDIYTDSLWVVERRDNSGAHTAGYWGNFIPQIPYQMMRRYTRKRDWVLDTFAGLGTTLIEGQRLGRHTIGIELQSSVAEQARRLIEAEPNTHNVVVDMQVGDSATINYAPLLNQHNCQSVQLVIMHPPYFDIIKFSDDPRDLSRAASIETFLSMMGQVVDNVTPLLDKGRYLIVVIGDKYTNGEWIPLGFYTMQEVMRRGFTLKSIIVKNFETTTGKRTQKELWTYRALVGGFYIFKHEYIFVFKK